MNLKFWIKKNKTPITLMVILILALVARLMVTWYYGAFSWDELFSFLYSQRPWIDSLRFWIWETNPPLHMVLLKFWWYFFPTTEFWARLPSTVAGAASLYLIYRFGQKLFNEKTAIYATIIAAFFPLLIHYSATARGYSILVLLSLLSMNFYYKLFIDDNQPSKLDYGWWMITNLLLLYLHLTSGLFIAAQFICLWFLPNKKSNLKKFILTLSPPVALWLIWFIPSLITKLSISFVAESWFFNMPINYSQLIFFLQSPFLGYQFLPALTNIPFHIAFSLGLTIIIIFHFYGTVKNIKNKNLWPIFAVSWGIFLFCAMFKFWHIKFFATSLPFFILLSAYYLDQYLRRPIIIVTLILITLLPGDILFLSNLRLNDWNIVAQTVETTNKNNKAFIYNRYIDKITIEHYLHLDDQTKIIGYRDPIFNNLTDDEIFIKQNYHFRKHEPSETQAWFVQNNLNSFDEIILFSVLGNGINLYQTLEQNGWFLKKLLVFGTEDPRVIFDYVKSTSTSTTI